MTTETEQAVQRAFDRAQENRADALKRLIVSAQQAVASIERGEYQRTDFVSQHAVSQLQQMNGLSEALGIVHHFAE